MDQTELLAIAYANEFLKCSEQISKNKKKERKKDLGNALILLRALAESEFFAWPIGIIETLLT